MTKEFANDVYDILVGFAGASEDWRDNFVYCHAIDGYGCKEYRFQGDMGHGGKYYSGRNEVNAYQEDMTTAMEDQIDETNHQLWHLKYDKNYSFRG